MCSCFWQKIFSWDVFQMFSPEEQTELAALVPKVDLSDDSSNALHERVFNYNHHLRESIDIFQENLHGGYYDPIEQEIMVEGLVDTQKSYDVWKEEHYEEVWGDQLDQEINDDILSLAKTLSLADLGKEDHLKPDDELHYTRRFGKKGVTVDRVVKVLNTGALLHVKVGKTEWTDIDSPTRLETLILDLDRRVPRKDRPNGNAWKSIRLKRNGKELGKLWNVRNELASMKYNKRN
ncbi:hypothetical protein BC832DRAFT_544487 [Gaertneriomyces semiglobifer]|nr:hypothetical protein BC832DRAFT_544487 [Gaertneriomyces semiglobifer]